MDTLATPPIALHSRVTVELVDSCGEAEWLKVSGKPDQYNDLSVFVREQELTKRLVGESILPKFELDISNSDISCAVKKIADWMESTGGLWME
jgi:hypothetical protein